MCDMCAAARQPDGAYTVRPPSTDAGGASLTAAIATIQDSRRTHVEWRDWWLECEAAGHTEECCEEIRQAARHAGGRAHQERCIAEYDNVLSCLRKLGDVK